MRMVYSIKKKYVKIVLGYAVNNLQKVRDFPIKIFTILQIGLELLILNIVRLPFLKKLNK